MARKGTLNSASLVRASATLRKQKAVEAVERLGATMHEAVVVDGTQMTTVGGAQVVEVGAAHSLTVGSRQTTDIGTDQSVDIGGSQTVTIGKDHSLSIGSGHSIAVGKSRQVEIAKDDKLEVAKDLTVVVGGKIALRATQELRLETGAASIVLKPDGVIQISGARITIEGSAEVHLKGANVHTN
ncbi:MAG: DUF2345 domain-containing protein [Alphaproteobacteria bacterium]|nr:DUF2345 domain-containing protein [Alphaproteobacteria bacterium]